MASSFDEFLLPPSLLDLRLPTAILTRGLSRSVDFRLLSSQVDSPCLARRDALDGLIVVATLAHELL